MQKRWEREDRGVEAAQTIEVMQLAELRQRVGKIERVLLNQERSGLSKGLIGLFGRILADLRRSINNGEIAELRREIEELKRSRTKYCGEYGTVYPEGAMVTRGGSVWYATRETREAPGEGQTSWTLAVKRGGAA
jgi:hypothetical protein